MAELVIRNLVERDMPDVLEMEAVFHAERKEDGGLILPSPLAWTRKRYLNELAENNQHALIAWRQKKVVGVLVYARPDDGDFFDVVRLVAHPGFEDGGDVRRALLGHMVTFCREDARRKTLRVFVNGNDLETIKFLEGIEWGHRRLGDSEDTWLYSYETRDD
jgi:hypothetical protein